MNRIAATLLVLEAVVVMLAIPVAVVVGDLEPAVPIPAGLGIPLLGVASAGVGRGRPPGYVLGSGSAVPGTAPRVRGVVQWARQIVGA